MELMTIPEVIQTMFFLYHCHVQVQNPVGEFRFDVSQMAKYRFFCIVIHTGFNLSFVCIINIFQYKQGVLRMDPTTFNYSLELHYSCKILT